MAQTRKFGTFGGVFTPSILTILGVIMYLRLPYNVGQAGFLGAVDETADRASAQLRAGSADGTRRRASRRTCR